jgi:hypothetical protein
MSVTYTGDTVAPTSEDVYVPSYARRPAKQKKVRTWMILAPIAAVALLGGGAYMLMNSGNDAAQPLAEPETAAPIATPMVPASPAPVAAVPVDTAPAPVVREAAPVRAAPPVARRESAPVRSATRPVTTPRVETPTQTGPQPYGGATSSLNAPVPAPRIVTPSIPAPTPAPAPAPVIVVQPLN